MLFIDASIQNLSYETTTTIIEKIYNPEWIVYYWGFDTFKDDLWYADELARKYRVILVGPWSYCMPDALKHTPHIRLMTYGEFEHTVLEIIQNPQIYSGFQGTYYRDHLTGEIVKNPPRPLCSSEELDKIPFVSEVYKRNLLIGKYRQTSFRYPYTDLLGARGCPYHCTFCLWIRAFQGGPSYRARSIKNVIEELWCIKNNLPQVKQVHFQDDTLPEKRMKDISETILSENLKITWSGYSRAEISRETLELFKQSGGRTLHVGYESANQRSLDIVEKGITVVQMEQFAKDIQDLDIWTCAGFMIYPWETKEEVRKTIKWVKKTIKPRRFSFTQLFPYPNTPICQTISKLCQTGDCLTEDEMTQLEKEGFKSYYLKNFSWWWDTLKHPREWKNVLIDGLGLVKFLWE